MPARPRLASTAAAKYKVMTWDEMVEEAQVDIEPFRLPMSKDNPDDVIEIPCPDGDRYMNIVAGQRTGNVTAIFENLIVSETDRIRLRVKMRGASFRIVDVLAGEVLSHYFGLNRVEDTDDEGDSGNSPAS